MLSAVEDIDGYSTVVDSLRFERDGWGREGVNCLRWFVIICSSR